MTCPSYSPENAFILPDGHRAEFTYGATMDLMIVNDLLTNCVEASRALGVDADFRKECEDALARLAPVRVSPRPGASWSGSTTTRRRSRTTATPPIFSACIPAT